VSVVRQRIPKLAARENPRQELRVLSAAALEGRPRSRSRKFDPLEFVPLRKFESLQEGHSFSEGRSPGRRSPSWMTNSLPREPGCEAEASIFAFQAISPET
jgi:hypothetical protein